MKLVAVIALSLVGLESVRAEVVYTNLNTDPSTTNLTYGFTDFAQRFTTVLEGTGLHLDLNIIALLNGPQPYTVELWSATGAGTNLDALLAPIGSGTVSTSDLTALTSFDLTYSLAASTNYFVKLTTTADAGWVLGPSSSTTLNSIFRYGVGQLNNTDSSSAGGMKVDVVAVPEPAAYGLALAGLAIGGFARWRRRRTLACFLRFVVVAMLCLGSTGIAHAQSTTWDSMLSNSSWYVPQENLLAYTTSGTSFTDPTPAAASDQTLWNLGTATNGAFSGTAVATLRPVASPLLTITNTSTITSGIVTDAGQIRMNFVAVGSGLQTIGIGQVRTISGTDYMQMQMITGNSSLLTTHWAYMAKYDPNTFVPPSLFPDGTLLSQEWKWTDGSTWRLQSDDLFGPGGSGDFTITNYRNGYFWGPGTGPSATAAATYTQLGSITPEGNVLFNVLIGGTLTSLAGQITGTGLTGQMALRSYDGTSFGPVGYATVVAIPEPATCIMALAGLAIGGLSVWRRRHTGA